MRAVPVALLIAAGWLVGDMAAQSPAHEIGASVQQPAPGFFALPWDIDFASIRRAMRGRSYAVKQVRRALDRRQPEDAWHGVIERLRYSAGGPDRQPAFELEFLGVEGATLQPSQLDLWAQRFQRRAGLLFHYHGFGVSDAALAEQNYDILLHGIATRLDRPVYRVTVVPELAPRTKWVLDLDIATGYPLYRGEYAVDGQRVAEIEVLRFDPTFEGGGLVSSDDPGVELVDGPRAAFASAGLASRGIPGEDVLPRGYELRTSAVITDLFSGDKKVRLVYTDGIDHLFVIAGVDSRGPLGSDHVIGVHHDIGMTQCTFAHDQVQYLVIGRASHDLSRATASALYAQAVRGR